MNSSGIWKGVAVLSTMLMVSMLCCLLGVCWGGLIGLTAGLRIPSFARKFIAPEAARRLPLPEGQPTAPASGQRPWLGVTLEMIPEGALLLSVSVDGPAERAGLQPGDVIITVDGYHVTAERPLEDLMAAYSPGDEVLLTVLRDGVPQEFQITLDTFPESELLPGPEYFNAPAFDEG